MCSTDTLAATAAGAALMYYSGGLGSVAGTAGAAATGAGAGLAVGATMDQKKAMEAGVSAQERANEINKKALADSAAAADQANNKANAKSPDVAGLSSSNALNAKGGQSGTMLTGPQGVDPMSLLLGKKTLLGG